eukprot:4153909-Pleurochrysis_carterae.AAC.1
MEQAPAGVSMLETRPKVSSKLHPVHHCGIQCATLLKRAKRGNGPGDDIFRAHHRQAAAAHASRCQRARRPHEAARVGSCVA